jgi:outer membrane protein OmpA-like peptidoglycan-associated protein
LLTLEKGGEKSYFVIGCLMNHHRTLTLKTMTAHAVKPRHTGFLSVIVVLLFSFPLFAQEPIAQNEWRLGALGGLSRLYHTSLLPIIPNNPRCCSYERGESWGWWGGLSGDYVMMPHGSEPLFEIGARALFARRPLALSQTVSNANSGVNFQVFDGVGSYIPSGLVRRLDYSAIADYLVADIGARVQPVQSIPLYVRLSADASFALLSQVPVAESELILQPVGVKFPDSKNPRSNQREPARLARPTFGVTGAIGVEVPLQQRLLLGLEAAYRYGLTTVRTDIDWRTNSVQGAVTLRWRFLPEETKRDSAETPQSEKTPPTLAAAQLLIESIAGKPLEIQETVVTQTFPLLPYIFFDSASVVVKNRYNPRIGTTANFDEQSLPKETLAIYYHLLHIIGKRMRANPKTTLTITGTTDGKEWANADQRQILAQQRARSVAGFLMGYWGIAQGRLKLTTRDTPKLASSDRYAEGNEENRRVELSSNDPELLAPVVQYRFLEYTPVRTEHYMTVKVQNPGAAESYKGSLNALEEPFAVTSGVDAPPTRLPFALRRKFTAKLSQTVGSLDSADCTLEVKQRDGQTLSAHTRINVETLKNQFEVSRLNLIVFDFDRDDMVESNRVMMRGFVLDAIKPNSLVSVLGSTDRLGEAKYNKELSESRAKGVQDFMRRVNPNIRFQEVRGTGASSLPFDNDLPEGRYYCRTVSINVQTPRGG